MPKDESTELGIVDEHQDEVSFMQPEQTATSEEEMSDYQRATVSEETSTDDEKPPEKKDPEVEKPEGEKSEGEKPAEETPGKDKPTEEKKADVPIGVQKRINKITKEKYEERRLREKTEAENRELRQKLAENEASKNLAELDSKEPKQDDFEEDADYYKAVSKWAGERAYAESKAKEIPKQAPKPPQQPGKATQQEIDLVTGMGRQAYRDFDKVVFTAEYMPDIVIKEACKTDIPHEIIYEIAQNKPLAEKLMRLNDLGVAEEIGAVAKTLLGSSESTATAVVDKPTPAKPTKQISNAPDPIKPSTGSHSVVQKKLSDLDHAAFRKKRGYAR